MTASQSGSDSNSNAKHQVEEEQANADLYYVAEITLGDGGGEAAATEGEKDRSPANYEIRLYHNQECEGGDDRK